jgi:hypothetical protein
MELTQEIIDSAPEGATHVEPHPPALYYKPDGERFLASCGGDDPWEPIMRRSTNTEGLTKLPLRPAKHKPADPLPVRETSRICASDEAGIKAFVKPPEVVKAEVTQRVSTLNRAWRWL